MKHHGTQKKASFLKINSIMIGILSLFLIINSCSQKTKDNIKFPITYPLSDLTDSITNTFQPLIDQNFKSSDSGMVAIATFLKEEDSILVDKSYFFSNNKMPLPNKNTIFQLGSVTKTFTATLIAKQVNSGRMHMNASAQGYLPKDNPVLPDTFKGNDVTITIGELTTMSSGLKRNSPIQPNTHSTPYTYAFSYLKNEATLLYKPGSECNVYSNLGFGVAGLTMSYQSYPNTKDYYNYYEQVVVDSLLNPMNMDDTRITLDSIQMKRRAIPYSENGGIVSYNNPNWPMNLAAGGLYSSIADMKKFSKNMIGEGKVLNRKDIDTLLAIRGKVWADTCKVSRNHYNAKQAMAWVVNRDMKTYNDTSFDRYSKDGGLAGFSTYVTLSTPIIDNKQYKAYVIILVNRNKFPVGNYSKYVQQLLYDLIPH